MDKEKIEAKLDTKETYNIINLRLNIIHVNNKYKNSKNYTKCEFCESDDCTEHLFECAICQRQTQKEMKAKKFESVDNMQEIRRRARYVERDNERKNKIMQYIQLRNSGE